MFLLEIEIWNKFLKQSNFNNFKNWRQRSNVNETFNDIGDKEREVKLLFTNID